MIRTTSDITFLSSNYKPTKKQRFFSKAFVKALPVIPVAAYISQSLPRDWNRIFDFGRLLYRENKKRYAQIVNQIGIDAINNTSHPLWNKTDGDLHLLFRFLALGDRKIARLFFEANMDKIKELGVIFIEVFPEHAIRLYKNRVRLRLFENHWNSASLDALKALHDFSVEDYNEILNSEVLQFANRISEMCILDFDKNDNIAIFMIAVIDTDNGYTVLCHLHSDDLLESYLESVQLFSVAVFVFHNSSILRMNVKP